MRKLIVGQQLNKYKLHLQENRRWGIKGQSDRAHQKNIPRKPKKPANQEPEQMSDSPCNCRESYIKQKLRSKEIPFPRKICILSAAFK